MGTYLDNAATSFPKPESVYQAVNEYMRSCGASFGRGTYRRAYEAAAAVDGTRATLASLLGVSNPSRIVFTSNVTESLNLALKGLLRQGDHVVTTSMEHNAVWRTLRTLQEAGVISLSVAQCAGDGSLNPDDLTGLIAPQTRLIVMTHASNVTGTILPVAEVAAEARRRGVAVLVDAAQTAGACPIDVEALDLDLLAFTGHKSLLGPQGTGGLYIKPGCEPRPLREGGTGSESQLDLQPVTLPERYEAGTLNVAGLAGLGAGVNYVLSRGADDIRTHETALVRYALERLPDVPDLTIYGPSAATDRVGVISFNVSGSSPAEVAYVLDEAYGIEARAGLHCAPCAHRTIGTLETGSVRISFGPFNTTTDVDLVAQALEEIAGLIGG